MLKVSGGVCKTLVGGRRPPVALNAEALGAEALCTEALDAGGGLPWLPGGAISISKREAKVGSGGESQPTCCGSLERLTALALKSAFYKCDFARRGSPACGGRRMRSRAAQ